jgi:NAD(P)-dependent dehydrogenase (short-subunit alcohol dehydrogenase family)
VTALVPHPTTDPELAGKRPLVTGGTRGIGAAVVARLAAAGARVALIAEYVNEHLGGVDILVHNVGGDGNRAVPLLTQADDIRKLVVDVNLLGPVRLDRALVPGMVQRGSGAVVHISSLSRSMPSANRVPYGAAEAALTHYSKGLANEVPAAEFGSTASPPDSPRAIGDVHSSPDWSRSRSRTAPPRSSALNTSSTAAPDPPSDLPKGTFQ